MLQSCAGYFLARFGLVSPDHELVLGSRIWSFEAEVSEVADQVPPAYGAEGWPQAVEGALITTPPIGGIVRVLESRR